MDKFNLRQTAIRTLAEWQSNNGVKIAPDAQSAIANSVADAKPELNRLLLAQSEQTNPESLTAGLIRHYCFNLRDANHGLQVTKRRSLSPWIESFQANPAPDVAEISLALVKAYTFLDFVKRLLSSLSTSMQVGQIALSSIPSSAPITIDKKAFGFTAASFVVSAGKHQVSIAIPGKACRRDVQIIENQTAAMACP